MADPTLRKIAEEVKLKPSQREANKGNSLAKQYLEKLRNEVSIEAFIISCYVGVYKPLLAWIA